MSNSLPASIPCLLSCLLLLLCCYTAATAQVTYYEMVVRHSGKCLDVNSASTVAGAQVWQWDCNGTHAQQWQLIDVGEVTRR